MLSNFEVLTVADKSVRDRLFEDFRKSDDRFERQVVKFSGNEPILGPDGLQKISLKTYGPTGRPQIRPAFRSNWSVAYPKS